MDTADRHERVGERHARDRGRRATSRTSCRSASRACRPTARARSPEASSRSPRSSRPSTASRSATTTRCPATRSRTRSSPRSRRPARPRARRSPRRCSAVRCRSTTSGRRWLHREVPPASARRATRSRSCTNGVNTQIGTAVVEQIPDIGDGSPCSGDAGGRRVDGRRTPVQRRNDERRRRRLGAREARRGGHPRPLRGRPGRRRHRSDARAGPDHGPDRPQRRRQDDVHERGERVRAADRRHRDDGRRRTSTGWSPQKLVRRGLVRTFQDVATFPELTVFENVELGALGAGPRAAARRAQATPASCSTSLALDHLARLPASALPHGEERRVGIARAVAGRAAVPAARRAGRRPRRRREPGARPQTHRRSCASSSAAACCSSSTTCAIIFGVCERIQVLDYGKSIAVGPPEEIRTSKAVIEAYLGEKGAQRCCELTDVSVHYGRIAAVQGLSLEVNEGELVGLVGHNGAGKSTTLWTITGVLQADARARSTSRASRSAAASPEEILRRGIALVPENRRIFGRLTVGENLQIGTSRALATARGRARTSSACASASRCSGATTTVRLEALGRRAAAARDRPRPARAPEAPAPRRADARARAAHRRPGLRDPPGAEGGGRRRSCSSSRTPRARSRSPTAPTCCAAAAASRSRAPPEELAEGGDFETAYIGMATRRRRDDPRNPVRGRRDRLRQPLRADGALAGPALQRDGPHELRLRRADHGRRLHDVLHARRSAGCAMVADHDRRRHRSLSVLLELRRVPARCGTPRRSRCSSPPSPSATACSSSPG